MKIQFKIIIVLLSISAVFADSDEECSTPEPKKICTGGPNDKWTDCGSACPPTCEKSGKICTKQCVLNTCQCTNGTVRASNGKCIDQSDCPWYEKKENTTSNTTPSTEDEKCTAKCTGGIYDKCTLCGTACPLTCDKPKVDICTLQCKVNVCQCTSGTVRASNGQCIKPEKCPPKTNGTSHDCPTKCTGGPHDECTNCGSLCPLTCDKPKAGICATVCVPKTCQCKTGFVRDTKSGQCVRLDQCPPKTNGTNHDCPTKCTGGPHDKCVKDCGNMCPPTCANPNTSGKCAGLCRPHVCRCENGYVRNSDGKCIKPEQCPKKDTCSSKCKGGPHDHCKKCGTMCPPTCKTPYPQACVEVCLKDACQCDDGYVRDSNGKCIKLEQCPKNTNGTTSTDRAWSSSSESISSENCDD